MLRVHLKKTVDDSYNIDIGSGIVASLPSLIQKKFSPTFCVIITDSSVKKLYGKKILSLFSKIFPQTILIDFPAGEHSKSRETKSMLEDKIFNNHIGKDCLLIALGGGVVGDVTGFVAATLFRGVPFFQIPTTLLAQVDSSSGGKTAVDHPSGKNLIGAYHQPKHLCIDTDFLATLTQEEYVNGIAEIIKQALIQDKKFFLFLEREMEHLVQQNKEILHKTIVWNCKLKANIIEKDEREAGPRKILNFGHTIGHALETLSDYELRHGYAVAIGMAAESRIAYRFGWLSSENIKRIDTLLLRAQLPVRIPKNISIEKIIAKTFRDKKNRAGKVKYSLIDSIGHCKFNVEADEHIVRECLLELQ
ncbi:MAG: 3-dehydroquinate synthase [Bacteroidota bacterium]